MRGSLARRAASALQATTVGRPRSSSTTTTGTSCGVSGDRASSGSDSAIHSWRGAGAARDAATSAGGGRTGTVVAATGVAGAGDGAAGTGNANRSPVSPEMSMWSPCK